MTAIHPALLARNTSKLRNSLRPVALAAMNGSSKDVAKLQTLVRNLPHDEAIGLLPVFYANLDPSSIPSLDVLDNIADTSTHFPCIENASTTLHALSANSVVRNPLFPLASAPDLWPRIWKWMEFLELYYDSVPARTISEVMSMRVAQSQILLKFAEHPQTCTEMFVTKGVRRILAAAWMTMVHHMYAADEPATLGVTALPLLALSDMKDLQSLDEVADGCGGSYDALVFTLTKNISQAVANSKSQMAVTSIAPVLLFLRDTFNISPDFVAFLLSHGIVSSLVSALDIDGLQPSTEGVPPQSVQVLCLDTLIQYLNVSPGYPWTVQALQAGLLRRIITFSGNVVTASDARKHSELLLTVLPRTMVFYPVIVEMKKSFSHLETLSRSEQFSRSVLHGPWNILKALVDARAKVLSTWEASGRASSLACYNLKLTKRNFSDVVRTAAYCSRECQRADWLDGHRDECGILLTAHLTYAEVGLPYREKCFIRALLHSDYQRLRLEISMRMLHFMTEHPREYFFVAFDYTVATGVQCLVLPATELGEKGRFRIGGASRGLMAV
ncbi:hypothetical protein DFH07DRAFT_968167 [Mycena maculata]|uniref:MYND-type domain-containing protein n=1 Tax=Mycena maculata TaxID=230809 RepID=A0AAD7I1U3_9AGAR|nr:hypothetical protein DFH07DRAFT_968167 [Mycena maculata]